MKKRIAGYICLCFAVCLMPFLGMAVGNKNDSKEKRSLQELPKLKEETGWNIDYLGELGAYFQDHFGFRSQLVTANARLQYEIFGVSAADGVIAGKDGWLFYKDSLNDYLGAEQMSERDLFNLAHSLAMMQRYVEAKGGQFLFTVAPNKNSLYGSYMPYYDCVKAGEKKNLLRLPALLEEERVNYGDVYEMLSQREEILYHKRDSHWNNKGAALASSLILGQLSRETIDWEEQPYEERQDFEGDLDVMLFPEDVTLEKEIYYKRPNSYAYVGEVASNFDPVITTVNAEGTGSLVMYRDSFGNALLPFFADSFADAYFSRGVPYSLTDLEEHHADVVVVERAERFLPDMAENPPVMQAPEIETEEKVADAAADGDSVTELTVEDAGAYWKITGFVSEAYLSDKTEIYLRFPDGKIYEAFPATFVREGSRRDNGFAAYMEKTKMLGKEAPFEVLIRTGESWINLTKGEIKG